MSVTEKKLMLGTAQWGWSVSAAEAYRLLDNWLKAGFRRVDCATNYPINRNPADFRAAEKILKEYTDAHGLQDLELTMKIGSLDNMRSPEVNLSPSFIQMAGEEYHRLFGKNLSVLMFHWDNREDAADIQASLESLHRLCGNLNLRPGLSGIAHPEAYAQANASLGLNFDIQLKHNVFQSDLDRYAPLERHIQAGGPHRYFAYGINAGGVKLHGDYTDNSTFMARGGQQEKIAQQLGKIQSLLPDWATAFVRPPVKTMNHLGLIYAGLHPGINGVLLGVSSTAQLQESLDFWRNLETFDYSDIFSALKKIHLPT
ncbi:MAG: aldo/keto reductase [Chitinophagales bacterium]|nr:aldo/keto reductase [Chitinophagales bacterium]